MYHLKNQGILEVKKTRTGNLDDFLKSDFTKGDFPKGIKRKPQGNVYYTLCSKCNSFFGSGMATVFLTNFIRCRTSFRMLFRLSLTMSLLGCDDLRQELTVKVRLPR